MGFKLRSACNLILRLHGFVNLFIIYISQELQAGKMIILSSFDPPNSFAIGF